MKTKLHSLKANVAPADARVWSAATRRRFLTGRHVSQCQSADMSAHSKGSARVPRASSGVAPELASPHLPGIMGGEKLVEPGFRRDAENHTPEARAPRNPKVRPMSVSQFGSKCRGLVVLLLALVLGATGARAVDFHVATAQDLQNALTLAAANGANNNIYVTNGYYIGNFNYNSAAGYNLAVTNEPGVTNTQITLDGAGGGRALNLASSGSASHSWEQLFAETA